GTSVFTSTGTFEMQSGTVNAILADPSMVRYMATCCMVTLNLVYTYTGLTNVTAGTLAEGSTGSIADASALTVNGATAIFDLGAKDRKSVVMVKIVVLGRRNRIRILELISQGSYENLRLHGHAIILR